MAKQNGKLMGVLGTIAKASISSKVPFLGNFLVDDILSEGDLLKGLNKLVDLGNLSDLDIAGLAKLSPSGLANSNEFPKVTKMISDAIEAAQEDAAGKLVVDKKLGKKTLNWLLSAINCAGDLERPDSSNTTKLPASAKGIPDFEYRYFIEKLPTASFNTKAALVGCWANWTRVCGVIASETKHRDKANVIVKLADIDGTGNVLADAHIGPASGFLLQLRIDKSETWDTEQKFESAICHEIGHLLGLVHSSTPNQLMNTHVGTVTTPQEEDKRIAQKRWGKSQIRPIEPLPELL